MRDISSNNHGDFYCYGCFYSFRTESKLESHYNLCKDHKYCAANITKQGKNFKWHKCETKALRMNDVIYLDLECKFDAYSTSLNDKKIPWTIKKDRHTVCGYSITSIRKHTNECIVDYYHGEDSLQVLCDTLTKHAKK